MVGMTLRDGIEAVINADIASGKATSRSLGVLYALAIASHPADDAEWWRRINRKIGLAKGLPCLDRVKAVGWQINERIASPTGAA